MFGEISQRLRGEQSPYAIPITIAPSIGPGLVVKAAPNPGAASAAIDLWAYGVNGYSSIQWYDSAGSIRTGRLNAYSGTGGGLGGRELNIGMDGSAATDALTLGTGFATRLRITGQGAISISAPASGLQALTVTGVAGSSALQLLTTGMQVGAPTGADKGSGTVNVAGGFYLNGVLQGGAAANPTASVGTAAVNGSATTFMRSDGAPAISQAITPTWTGLHTFTTNGIKTSSLAMNSQTPVGVTSGFGTPTGNVIVANFPGATATLVQCSNTIAELLVLLKAFGLIGT